jgi:ParB-like chromosome segregation protein Spo0J
MIDDQQAWPADSVERVNVANLVPYARNARTHSAERIREWGWTIPVLVDESGTLIAGHGRLLAAHQLGIESVPAMRAVGWSEAKRRAYAIADNKLALNAGWDDSMLAAELGDLGDLDMLLTGFTPEEVAALTDVPNFPPGTEEDQGRLDQLEPKWAKCPHCGEEFNLREQS